jgi:ketosteroid isomerase-like protein
MMSWLAHRVVSFQMARLRAGDVRPTLLLDAPDVRMDFPGQNSWAPGARGKADHARWLERFVRVGLQIYPDEVIVRGFPWRQTICVRGHDSLRAPDGELVYENRYVIWGHLVWGRLKQYEVYEDTEKTAALDGWLEQHEHPAVPAVSTVPA